MLHSLHPSFLVWAAVLGAGTMLILTAVLGRMVRRHLTRLIMCLAIGAVAAFGVTAWADGQRHAALAAAAHARHGAVSVTGQLAAAFTVTTVVVTTIAFVISTLAARRQVVQPAPDRAYRRYSAARRDW
jgi:hypothetical protein